MTWVLAWRPFIDPLDLHDVWYLLLVPLALGIAVVYKAVRLRDITVYWRPVFMMTVQIILAIVGLAVASYLFFQVVVPSVVPMEW